ncbi:hypothetical protein Btru_061104 [Bulinus truncatus]|nr:hypothetical protein Btru_061104 [Bulinus truncatus]
MYTNYTLCPGSTCNDVKMYTNYTLCPGSTCNDVKKYTDYTVCPMSTVNLLASYRPLLYMERPGSVFFIQLSSNGFFYSGRGVSVTCVGCNNSVELARFVSEPSSEVYHKTGCEFIRVDNSHDNTIGDVLHSSQCDQSPSTDHRTNIDINNVVAGNSESTRTLSEPNQTNYEVSSLTSLPSSGQTFLSQLTSSQTPPVLLSTQSNLTLRNAAYPVYGTWKKRMETLVNLPKEHIHSPSALAHAGFFYAGYSDCVRCFYCGLGLRSWKPGDDIYVEHGRHRPTCSYLQTLLNNKQLNIDNTETVVPVTGEINNVAMHAQNELDPIPTSISDSSNSRMEEQQTEGLTQGAGAMERSTTNSTVMTTETNQTSRITERESLRVLTKSLLQRENQALKQLMKCKACNVAPIQDLFLPCGEMYTCKDCSNKFTHCPSCGKRILGTVTVYFT